MFATKPATPTLEFRELNSVFARRDLALLFDRDPDTVGRWSVARRVPRTVEQVVDRFWWVMHVACSQRAWPVESARYFLLTIAPELGVRPAALVRESDAQCDSVVQLILGAGVSRRAPRDVVLPEAAVTEATSGVTSPFDDLFSDEPIEWDAPPYRLPSLRGRLLPISDAPGPSEPFRFHYVPSSRAAFPNDFVATVGRAIAWAWRKRRFAGSDVALHLHQWRVGFYGPDERLLDIVVPYDERRIDESGARAFVEEIFEAIRSRLPIELERAREQLAASGGGVAIRDFSLERVRVLPTTQISLRALLDMPPLDLEHLTYGSESIVGVESHIEREA